MPESEELLKRSWQDADKEKFLIFFVNRFESVLFLIWNRNGAISDTI